MQLKWYQNKRIATNDYIRPMGNKRTVLIMDDEAIVCEVLSDIITFLGHEAIVAHSGEHALQMYDAWADSSAGIDLAIMDLTIPSGMGGKETVKRVLAKYPEAKIIVTSGYSTDPIVVNYEQYGFSGVLLKPFKLDQVTTVINHMLAT
jgi:CheY-like chemotaxis protein